MFRDFIPGLGDRSTRNQLKKIFRKMDKRISLHLFIVMFIMESIKNYVAGNLYVATRMMIAALLTFIILVLWLEYGEESKEVIKEKTEETKEKLEEVSDQD